MCNKNDFVNSISFLNNIIEQCNQRKMGLIGQRDEIDFQTKVIEKDVAGYRLSILAFHNEIQTTSKDLVKDRPSDKQKESFVSSNIKRRGELIVLIELKKHKEGITRQQIQGFTGYSESTTKTYIRSLRGYEYIKQEGAMFLYVKGLDGVDIVALLSDMTPFWSTVKDVICNSDKPVCAQDILKSLEKSEYDFKDVANPLNKISTNIGKLKDGDKPTIEFSHKDGKTPYYRKKS